MASLANEVRALCNVIQARLNGHPDSAAEWQTITRQLRSATDKSRKIAKLAERMEGRPSAHTETNRLIDVVAEAASNAKS